MSVLYSEGRILCARVLRYLKILSFTLFRNSDVGQILHSGRGNLKWLMSIFAVLMVLRAKLMSQLNSEGRIHCARVLRYLKIPSFTLFSIGQNLGLGARETKNGYPIFDISHGLRAKLMSVLSSEGSIHEVRVSKLLQYPIIYSVQNVIISVTRVDSTAKTEILIWLLLVAGEN